MRIIMLFVCFLALSNSCSNPTSNSTNDLGQNSSRSRFAILNNKMYSIDVNKVKVFDISQAGQPVSLYDLELDYGLETIFIENNFAYVGARDGIYILDLTKPNEKITKTSKIEHQVACDPVVVKDNIAYSTQNAAVYCKPLFSTSIRRREVSILAVYDVTDSKAPKLLQEIRMFTPYGLGIKNDRLYVCDEAGLFVFNISEPKKTVTEVERLSVPSPRDIIIHNDLLIVIAKKSYELYNCSNPNALQFLGHVTK